MSYAEWSGDFYFASAEKQDVEVVDIHGEFAPQRLTQHGGALSNGGIWSPTDDFLAFSGDDDEQGISQLFVYDVNRRQTLFESHLSDPKDQIESIVWSPQGDKIAFVIRNRDDSESIPEKIWLASLKDGTLQSIPLPDDEVVQVGKVSYSENGDLVVFGLDSEQRFVVLWLGANDYRVTHKLLPEDIERASADNLVLTNPFVISRDGSVLGFISRRAIIVYDSTTAETYLLSAPWLLEELLVQDVMAINFEAENCLD